VWSIHLEPLFCRGFLIEKLGVDPCQYIVLQVLDLKSSRLSKKCLDMYKSLDLLGAPTS
jgi:hypothetical protein